MYKLGLTTWSPLAFGTLTGKYSTGKPESSRFTTPTFDNLAKEEQFTTRVKMADELKPIADELGRSLAQFSIAWAVSNENVSTVLIAASRPSHLEENVQALNFASKITSEVKVKIDAVVKFVPFIRV
ncbi:unnamed protein product [Phytophthora lilii]|uniref:Unnamed protein product n=1 Tax=Phytophthora lilii TaxID=2077276 RepID=A0A9W6TMZ8_9STRA|nr:unnamed protein product [Phytophthora lilii]